jgi:hypothetical protein
MTTGHLISHLDGNTFIISSIAKELRCQRRGKDGTEEASTISRSNRSFIRERIARATRFRLNHRTRTVRVTGTHICDFISTIGWLMQLLSSRPYPSMHPVDEAEASNAEDLQRDIDDEDGHDEKTHCFFLQ